MVKKRRLAICVLLTAGPLMAADAAPPVSDEAVDAIVQQIDAGRYPEALAAAKKAMSAYKPQPTGKGMDKAYVGCSTASPQRRSGRSSSSPRNWRRRRRLTPASRAAA